MSDGRRRMYRLTAAAIVLFAFLLRVYRFAELPPGLFFDEAYNALDALNVLNGSAHPVFFAANNGREPFFIYLQSILIFAVGIEPLVIRLPSVFLGTLTVALTYPLVRRLLSGELEERRERIALLSSFLLATTQWHLNFSRMGFRAIALPLFEALALYLFYRATQNLSCRRHRMVKEQGGVKRLSAGKGSPPVIERRLLSAVAGSSPLWFALAGVAGGLGIYTYLSARLLPVALIVLVVAGVFWGQRISKRYLAGLAVFALSATVTAAPLLIYYFQHPDLFVGHSADVSLLNFGGLRALIENATRLFGMFNLAGDVNWRHNLSGRPVFDPLIGICFVFGVLLVLRRLWHSRASGDETWSGYLAPVVFVPVMLVPSLLSESAPHFLRSIGVLPLLMIFPAVGLEAAWRYFSSTAQHGGPAILAVRRQWLVSAGFAAILVFSTAGTYQGYFVDWGGREDPYYHFDARYLDLARYLQAQDAGTRIYLSPWLANHATARLLLRDQPYSSFDSDRTLVLTDKEALYAFEEGGVDREGFAAFAGKMPAALQVERQLDRYGRPAYGFFRLKAVDSPVKNDSLASLSPLLVGAQRPAASAGGLAVTFGDDLTLMGFVTGVERQTLGPEVSAGSSVPLMLIWRPQRSITDQYTVSLSLVDQNGRRWAQFDSLIGGEKHNTASWHSDEVVVDQVVLNLPDDLAPGDYRLTAGVYSLITQRSLELTVDKQPQGRLARLGSITVDRPSPQAMATLKPPQAVDKTVDGATLLGFGLDRAEAPTGEAFNLDLYWLAQNAILRDLWVKVDLKDSRGRKVSEQKSQPANGAYPTTKWRPGDALRDSHRIEVPAIAGGGMATLHVVLQDDNSNSPALEIDLPGPEIKDREHNFALPDARFGRPAIFSDKAALLGFETEGTASAPADVPELVAKSGAELTVTLYWQALSEMATSYTVFVQVLNAQGQLVAQQDSLPLGGRAPTSSWLAKEVVSDRYAVPLKAGLPTGNYTLIAGLYNAMDGKRLPVGDGDFVKLATLKVGE